MLNEPNDFVLKNGDTSIRFAAWHMAYGKGCNAGIQIKVETKADDGRVVDPNDLFGRKTKAIISVQDLMSGMTYKDLMDLSKWAKDTARFVKAVEVKYRGVEDFNRKHMCNELKEIDDVKL